MTERARMERFESTEETHTADLPLYPDSNGDTGLKPDRGSPPRTPRWVKVFAIIAIVLVLLFVILQFTGGVNHGPRRHSPLGADLSSHTLFSSITADTTLSGGDLGSYTPASSITEEQTPPKGNTGGSVTEHGVPQL